MKAELQVISIMKFWISHVIFPLRKGEIVPEIQNAMLLMAWNSAFLVWLDSNYT